MGDVPALLVMMRAFSGEDEVAWRPRRVVPALRRLLRAPRLGRVVVSAAGGELRGYAIGTFGYDLEFGGADARRLYQTAGFAPIPRLVLSKRLGRSARGAA